MTLLPPDNMPLTSPVTLCTHTPHTCPHQGHPQHLVLPHLGACTREAETKAAGMAAASVKEYLELGNVRHSVNFPAVALRRKPLHDGPRLCIVVNNEPGECAQCVQVYLGTLQFKL